MSVSFSIVGLTELVNEWTLILPMCVFFCHFSLGQWGLTEVSVGVFCSASFTLEGGSSLRHWGRGCCWTVQWRQGRGPGIHTQGCQMWVRWPCTHTIKGASSHCWSQCGFGKKEVIKMGETAGFCLLCGEDLAEGAQAREVTEVPYQIPTAPRERNDCPVCQQSFKTHHCLMVNMGFTGVKNTHVQSMGKL